MTDPDHPRGASDGTPDHNEAVRNSGRRDRVRRRTERARRTPAHSSRRAVPIGASGLLRTFWPARPPHWIDESAARVRRRDVRTVRLVGLRPRTIGQHEPEADVAEVELLAELFTHPVGTFLLVATPTREEFRTNLDDAVEVE